MISSLSGVASNGLRPQSPFRSDPNSTASDARPDAAVATATTGGSGIAVSQLQQTKQAKPIAAADDPVLRDLMATNWVMSHGAAASQSFVSDDAPRNTYSQVKVDGKVVATIYNGGSSTMTNDAAAKIGALQDPPGLGGPDLAQWRADNYARLLGGTVEKASTAITQSQWTPHPSGSTTYSKEQLDAAFEAMLAEGRQVTAQLQSSYQYQASQAQAGGKANLTA